MTKTMSHKLIKDGYKNNIQIIWKDIKIEVAN